LKQIKALGLCWYEAIIWGVKASGRTLEEAVQHAIREHQPYGQIESEDNTL
jgi:hypothetical protein